MSAGQVWQDHHQVRLISLFFDYFISGNHVDDANQLVLAYCIYRKILRKIDEMTSQASVIKPECFTQYKNVCVASTKLGEFTHEVRKHILEYARARREGVKTETIHQTIFSVTDSHLGINETGMWDGCRKTLTGLLQDITALAEGILDSEISVKGTSPFIILPLV